MSSDARSAVLSRIRSALGGSPPTSQADLDIPWRSLPRDYQHRPERAAAEMLALFEERLRDYDAEVTRVDESGVAMAIAQLLKERGLPLTLVPSGFPQLWRPALPSLVDDLGGPIRALDSFDGVLTAATLAIAETGTLVLQNVPGQGRRAATLIPDHHLCVVRATEVVNSVPEAFTRLDATSTLPTTFVSGPSATADIEMTRIKGVHGPRFLHVLLVLDKVP